MKYLLLALALITSACGKDDSKSGTTAAPGPDATAAPAAVSELEGVWSSDCLPVMPILSFKAVRTFTGNIAKSEVFGYADGFCSASALRAVTTYTDTFRIGAATTPAGAKKIDYTVTSISKIYKEKTNADDAATANDYGYSDWKAEVAKDIAGKRRQPNDDPEGRVGQVFYTIFKIDGKKLYGGDNATGKETSDDTRPTDLVTTVFTKQ